MNYERYIPADFARLDKGYIAIRTESGWTPYGIGTFTDALDAYAKAKPAALAFNFQSLGKA